MSAGEVGEAFGLVMPRLPLDIPFIESKHYNRIVERHTVDLVVLHAMESPETPQRAEQCARYMATLADSEGVKSAHYYVDCDSVVQGVPENRIAYHAPGANLRGVGIEHAGRARQTREDWLDDFGIRMLSLSAQLTARACKRWGIPLQFVPATGLLVGTRGITTHAECTKAWKRSTHTDPGAGFPADWYIARAKVAAGGGAMSHGAITENGSQDADTVVSVRAFKELQGAVHGHALMLGQLGEMHGSMNALTRSNTVLAGKVGESIKALDAARGALDGRGLTRLDARVITLSVFVAVAAEVIIRVHEYGARAGWW